MTGGGADASALSAKMADAWVQIARTGNPNHADNPAWAAFGPKTIPTLVFDDKVDLLLDPDRAERESLLGLF